MFDKTGTLTKGVFEVQNIHSQNIPKEELLKIVAYAEKLMKEKQIVYEECKEIGTILYVAIDNQFAGSIVIADEIKEDSKIALQELKQNGIYKTVMLTGDKSKVAQEVAKKLEIEEVYSELLPAQKVEKVEKLLKDKKANLAFVGDGINDSPVLAISNIGIAMGGLEADAAIEAADIVIMTDEPSKLVTAMKIAKKTMTIVKENIIFAITVKVAILLLTTIRIVCNVGSSICRRRSICYCNIKCIKSIKSKKIKASKL